MPGRLLTVSGHEAQMKELSSVSDERDKSFDFSNAEVGASLANCLADSDFRLANLEGFIYESSSCSSYTAGRILADPLKFISSHGIGSHNLKILSDLNINCFSVANNHILDGKIEGVRETIGILKRHKLKWVGFGKDFESAWKPRIVKVRDSNIVPNKPMKIAIFALSDHYTEWRADDRQPGINFFNVEMFSFEEENPNWERWTNFSHVTNEIRKGMTQSRVRMTQSRVRAALDHLCFGFPFISDWGFVYMALHKSYMLCSQNLVQLFV